jgi:AAA ATPase domain
MLDSPYTPGAGHTPPILAGRELLESEWRQMLSDIGGSGRTHARDIILCGPRGVGKTVLLSSFQQLAEDQGYDTIQLQMVSAGAGLIGGILAHAKHQHKPAWQHARAAAERLTSINATSAGFGTGVAVNDSTRQTPVDPGSLAQAIATLAHEIRAEAPGCGLLISLDELQVSRAGDLALLAAALEHLNVEYPDSSVAFAASALPNINDALREAGVTHADGLFEIQAIPVELARAAARFAIVEPARQRGVIWSELGAGKLLAATHGYPAHLQLFADETWKLAAGPREITVEDAERGVARAEQLVETRTLDPRWQRAADRQVQLLAALAVVSTTKTDTDYATTAEISHVLGRTPQEWSETRIELINESDIYAPSRGRLAFTVPTYSRYVLRHYEARRAEARLRLTPLSVMSQRMRAPERSSVAQLAR